MPETRRPTVAVISHLYPSRARENYGVFVYEQTRALIDSGFGLTALIVPVPWAPQPLPRLSDHWRAYAAAERQRTDFGSLNVEFPRYLSFPRKQLRAVSAWTAARSIAASRSLPAALRSSDVIVAHTALLDGAIARLLASDLRIPYVVFVHGEDLFQNARGESQRLRVQVGRVLLDATTVIAVSDVVRDGLLREFPGLTDVRVLCNGVDTDMFVPRGGGTGATDTVRPLRILSAGRLVTSKSHQTVLRATAELLREGVDIRYEIAGDGPLRASLEALARELNIESYVEFTGAYAHARLPSMLETTDLFVLSGWDEAFGVVYLESLACGVPVVAASDGGAQSIVTEGVDGYLVRPRDVEHTATAIRAYAALDTAARDAMRTAARTKALTFTWRRNAAGLMEILTDITSAHGAGTIDVQAAEPPGGVPCG